MRKRLERRLDLTHEQYLAEIQKLVKTLNYHTDLYNAGKPEISDREWDDKYFKLQKLEKESGIYLPDSPTQSLHYDLKNCLEEIKQTHFMGSLEKTKEIDGVKAFSKGKKLIAMGKMDGLSCALRYEDGALVKATSRGKIPLIGFNVLEHIKGIKNIPKRINKKGIFEVDGEVICKYSDFEKFAQKGYKSARNFAAGSLALSDPRECAERDLSFVAWDYINNPYDTLGEALEELGELNFTTVPWISGIDLSVDNLEEIIKEIKKRCQEQSLPIDGAVFKYDNVEEYKAAGFTESYPNGGLAFKFYDEEYESELIDIVYDIGRTGTLTPVAVFKDVEIDGATINRATLSNMSILYQTFGTYTPFKGTKVFVTRRNMVIPHIERVENIAADELSEVPELCPIPERCPLCGGETVIRSSGGEAEKLMCTTEECEGNLAVRIAHYCNMTKGMKIKGISRATIEKLIEWEWIESIKDIYTLKDHRDEWVKKPGFGPKSVDKLLAAIEKSKDCQLWQFISALGIPLIGETASRVLEAHFSTWATLYKANQENFIFSTIPNFGYEMEKSLQRTDLTIANEIATSYLRFTSSKESVSEGNSLADKTIVITGKLNHFKNRDALKEAILAQGGEVAGSVSAKTDFLLTNDTSSGSSKNVTAQKLGVKIISEDEFIEKFLS